MSNRILAILCAVFAVFLSGQVAVAVPYYVTDLGPVGSDTLSVAYAISVVNGSSQAVGFSQTAAANRTPVAWIGGAPTNLLSSIPGTCAGSGNAANGINGSGDIVGATLVSGTVSAYYLPYGGTGTILPTLGGTGPTSAAGVSGNGFVVGNSVSTDTYVDFNGNTVQAPHAFVWSASTGMVDLGLTNNCSYATGISADGNTIIGDIGASGVGQLGQAVKWTRSGSTWTMTPLVQKSQYNQTVPYSINSSGDAVGGCFDYPEGGFPNVFQIALEFKHDGSIVRIGALTQQSSAYARGINDSGVIVGYDGYGLCFVNYTQTPDANIDLSTLLSPISGAGWSLKYVYGIDNNGNIVGRGTSPGGTTHGFILKPAMAGDANLDAVVNIADLSKVLTNYDKTGLAWADGDFNGDGIVDISDLSNVLTNYDKSATAAAGITAVPEPGTLGLLAAAAIALAISVRRVK